MCGSGFADWRSRGLDNRTRRHFNAFSRCRAQFERSNNRTGISVMDCSVSDNSRAWSQDQRLAALRDYAILDTEPEIAFEDITRIAAEVCNAPMAMVSFVEETRQWFKSEIGLGVCETSIDVSICAHAIKQDDLFVIPDTTCDARFADNPLVTGDTHVRFYAGAVLKGADGLPLGTVCVLDTEPRPHGLTPRQAETLTALSRSVIRELELRVANRTLREAEERLRLALQAGRMCTWEHNLKTDCPQLLVRRPFS